MDYIKRNRLAILIILILFAGLIISVYLVKVRQIFKSKASWSISSSLSVGDNAQQSEDNGIITYTVSDNKINIRLKEGTIENINQSLESKNETQ